MNQRTSWLTIRKLHCQWQQPAAVPWGSLPLPELSKQHLQALGPDSIGAMPAGHGHQNLTSLQPEVVLAAFTLRLCFSASAFENNPAHLLKRCYVLFLSQEALFSCLVSTFPASVKNALKGGPAIAAQRWSPLMLIPALMCLHDITEDSPGFSLSPGRHYYRGSGAISNAPNAAGLFSPLS